MNYDQVLEFMFNSLPMYQRVGQAAYKANLDNTLALDKQFGFPHREFKTIHVAGTNGKGSVSHSLASVLQEAGYKTGLYTSPHLVDYRERIRVNGKMISKEFITGFINSNAELLEELKPSFFEMSVAMAFDYFRFCKVDIAVVEVGMGGRLDSTNIITPEISVITNIGLDHTQFLGDSLEKIAAEKAGIIKSGIPVVIGESQPETKNVFSLKASELNSEISFADEEYEIQILETGLRTATYSVTNKDSEFSIEFGLTGEYQKKNLGTILNALEKLRQKGIKINNNDISRGLKNVQENTGLHGRWEVIAQNPLCICDTGHNKEGLSYVMKQISTLQYKNLHIVLGFVNDKNVSGVLPMFPKEAKYYFTQASIPRAMPAGQLKEEAAKHGLTGDIFENVISAYQNARRNADKNDMIFVGGSTFVVGDLIKYI